MAGESASAWIGASQFHPATGYPGIAGSDAAAENAIERRVSGAQPGPESLGRRECQNRRCIVGCFWRLGPGHTGSVVEKEAGAAGDRAVGALPIAAQDPA